MGAFFIYILKSSVCLVLFYLFFRVLLSKETFHRFNRVALLGVLFLSLLIPFIEVTTNHQVEVQQTMLTIEQVLLMAEMEPATVRRSGCTRSRFLVLDRNSSACLSVRYYLLCLPQSILFDPSFQVNTFR